MTMKLLIFVLIWLHIGHVFSLNVILKTLSTCKDKNYKTRADVIDLQYLGNYVHKISGNLTTDDEIGPNTKYSAFIYKNNRKLPINFSGKDGCKSSLAIFGELAQQVLAAAQPKVEKCPLKKGVYTLKNHNMDMKQIKIPLPVKGNFKVKIILNNISTNKDITCIDMDAELQ